MLLWHQRRWMTYLAEHKPYTTGWAYVTCHLTIADNAPNYATRPVRIHPGQLGSSGSPLVGVSEKVTSIYQNRTLAPLLRTSPLLHALTDGLSRWRLAQIALSGPKDL